MDIRLLGPVEAHHEGRRIGLGRRKERCLLGLLVLEAGRHLSTDRLIDLLWTDQPPANARAAVHTSVARLRARLAPYGVELVSGGGGYAADVDPESVDAHRFSRQAAAAEELTDPAERAAALREALRLWRGPLLADVADDLVRARVGAVLEERRLVAAERLAEAELDAGRPDHAIADVVDLVEEDPARERLAALLVTALHRSGRPGDALAAYRRTEAVLAGDLGLEPGPELRALRELILAGDAAAAGAEPGVRHGRRYLPADVPHFTGRADDLRRLERLVGDAAGRPAVVVVTGSAGVGKTALAVHWAHAAADRFPDGQLFLNLRGYEAGFTLRPLDALVQLLRALEVPERTIPAELDAAAALYRSVLADRRVLVLLDNAGDAEQVRPLVPAGRGSVALVTSRQRLSGLVARDGARRLDLDVLPLDDAVALLGRVAGGRIAADPDASRRLAGACARLPLALRIAAAHLADRPGLGAGAYVRRLEAGDRLAALEIDGDGQASVRAAFALSHRLLDGGAARLFRLLGLAPGADVSIPAAAALAGTTTAEARRLLDRLHAACLVERPAPDRYACHDLLRLYARELAGARSGDERRRAVERLDRWYLRSAEAAAALLYPQMARLPASGGRQEPPPPFDEPAQALAWLGEEWTNLAALVRSAAERQAPSAWQLADALRGYLTLSRRLADWPAIGAAALGAAEAADDASGRAAAHFGLATCSSLGHRHEDAVEHLDQARAAAREAGWVVGQAAIVGSLSVVHRLLGRFRESRECLDETLTLARRCGWTDGEATALGNLGFGYLRTGPLPTAVEYLTQSIDLHRRRGHPGAAAMFLGALADACRGMGRIDQAYERVGEALALFRSVGDRASEALGLGVLAHTHRQAGCPAEAAACAAEAVAIGREVADPGVLIDALAALGAARLALGDAEGAAGHHSEALARSRERGVAPGEAVALLGLAAADRHAGRHQAAEANAAAALALARSCELRLLEGEALGALAAAVLTRAAVGEAVALAGEALDVHEETGHHFGRQEAWRVLDEARRRAPARAGQKYTDRQNSSERPAASW